MDRILVVLPNWFGETLFATPFLRALRQQRPAAFIATLGWPQCRDMLLHNPHVTEIMEYDERGAHRGLVAKWRLVQALRARRFDTAFILRNSLSRSLLLVAARIPARIGFANRKSGWVLTRRVVASAVARHKASSYLPLLEAVGLTVCTGPYEYFVSVQERRAACEQLASHHLGSGRPFVVLHPGANWPHKRWATERFAALGDRLVETQGVQVVITGGLDDAALAKSIASRMRTPPVVLAGQTTLRELGACLERAHVVVSNDTGILHMAAALGRPVVALYGPTSPALTGPLGEPHHLVVIHHADCCPQIPCYHPPPQETLGFAERRAPVFAGEEYGTPAAARCRPQTWRRMPRRSSKSEGGQQGTPGLPGGLHPDRPAHPGMDAITVDEAYDAAVYLLTVGAREGI